MMENLEVFANHQRHTFAPYHLKTKTARGNRIISGRDSLMLYEGRIEDFDGPQKELQGKTNLEFGSFCQQATGVKIFLGGEHRNDMIVNNSLSHFEELKFHLSDGQKLLLNSYSKGPTLIGNNVIISRNVSILSGVKIGDGAVLAANSVITKEVPPFAIVGGNPAKVIKRFPRPEEKDRGG